MFDARPLNLRAGRARRCIGVVGWGLVMVACRNEPSPNSESRAVESPAGASPAGGVSSSATAKLAFPYVCDAAHDYRAFERSAVLARINWELPRKEQTREQAEDLTPGDPLWQLDPKPDISCSADGLLQLRYAPPGPTGFEAARNRLTVTFAPGARLLDPLAHARMKALAESVDEALRVMVGSRCMGTDAPCVLTSNPEPLRYPGASSRHAPEGEFPPIGQRAWLWQSRKTEQKVLRAIFCTTDGKFDVELLVEAMDAGDRGMSELELLPVLLSHEYDERPRQSGDRADGGSRG
jgi:hypothetical protein